MLAACDPKGAVNITKQGSDFVVEFENCTRPAQVLQLKELDVRIAGSDAENAPWCFLERTKGPEPMIEHVWTYGEEVPGYSMNGCRPLQPNTTYEVSAHIAVVVATSTIRVDGKGVPHRTKGACR